MDTSARQALNALIDQLATGSPQAAAPQLATAFFPTPMLPVQPLPQQRSSELPDGALSAILWRSRVA